MLYLLMEPAEDVFEVDGSLRVVALLDVLGGEGLEIVELLHPLPHTTRLLEITSATHHQKRLTRKQGRTPDTPTDEVVGETAEQGGLISEKPVDRGIG